MLEHLRVLDLTDERGLLCGRLLADLGADVVQVEPLAGSSARSAPPTTEHGPRSSMFWAAFAAGKRSVALDLDHEEGLGRLRELARRADILVTSWPRDWLAERGLDPQRLRDANPGLVYTVVSAFGWDGPKADYADSDLVVWAAGGPLDPHRDTDRAPLRISVPQAFLHAAADAAAGTLLAVLGRAATATGQTVDVSAQASLGVATLARSLAHSVGDERPEWHKQPTAGDRSGSGAATPNRHKKWYCRDGLVELHLSMGRAAGSFTNRLFAWLHEEGAIDDTVAGWDWTELPERMADGEVTEEDLDRARGAVRAFLATRTKSEVVEAAMRRRLLCMAVYDIADIVGSEHLAERGFWSHVDIDGAPTRIPGVFAQVTGGSGPHVRGPAPSVGQHNEEVVGQWLARTQVPT